MIDRLIMGTAGLSGQPYGRNQRVVGFDDAVGLLNRAYKLGIRAFDTAPLYGNAEKAVGAARNKWSGPATIFTKNNGSVGMAVESIKTLGQVPKFLVHNWTTGNIAPWYTGVTTYSDVRHLPDDGVIQIDWNILNQRATSLKTEGRIIARSVFLQGVLLGEPLPHPDLIEHVKRAEEFAQAIGTNLITLAIRAALEHPLIRAVLIGPTSIPELEQCIEAAQTDLPCGVHPSIGILDVLNRSMTDPRGFR